MTERELARAAAIEAQQVTVPDSKDYFMRPRAHLQNVRDKTHFDRAVSFMLKTESKFALDIGCYDGWLDFLLIAEGFQMTGIELIKGLARIAKRYADRNFITYKIRVGYVLDIERLANEFDVCFCFETLEHMPYEDAKEAVKLMGEWATKGFLISLPDQKFENNCQHMWTPTEEVIKDLVPNGTVDKISYPGTDIPANWFVSTIKKDADTKIND